MTKRTKLDAENGADFFGDAGKQTAEQTPEAEAPEDRVKAYGVGLKISEWERIEEIAAELGKKRHAVALYALRDFIRRYDAGEIGTVTQKSLPGL